MSNQAPFRYDVVGSFLRPEYLKDARAKFAEGKITEEQLKETEDKEYTISCVRVVENAKENRLQLFFAGIPSKEIRSQLKENNTFRWTPSIGCWQSYLNRWCIERAKVILNSITE